jgi:hypothetical protein
MLPGVNTAAESLQQSGVEQITPEPSIVNDNVTPVEQPVCTVMTNDGAAQAAPLLVSTVSLPWPTLLR